MKTIWKSVVRPNSVRNDALDVSVPARAGARALSVGLQHNAVCVWFEVDAAADPAPLKLWCVGTGFGAVPEGKRFLGTVVDGPHVWHLYADL